MKYLLLVIFLCINTLAHADFSVLYNNSTGEIINYSKDAKNFNIAPDEKSSVSIKNIKGNIEDYTSQAPIQNYKISNDALALNIKKINDMEKIKNEAEEKLSELQEVDNKAKLMAYTQLQSDGTKFKYINEKDFQ